jgi:hypothetical protein
MFATKSIDLRAGGGKETLLFYIGVRGVTAGCPAGAASAEQIFDLRFGAEPDAVEISYLLRPLYISK